MDPLTSISGLWETSETRTSEGKKSFDGVPDGEHTAVLRKVEYTTNQYGGSIVEDWYFPQFDKVETVYLNIKDNAGFIKMLKAHVYAVAGVNAQSPKQVPDLLKTGVGSSYTVKKEYKAASKPGGKGFRNIYVNKKLSGETKTEPFKKNDISF